MKFEMKPTEQLINERGLEKGGPVQKFIDAEVLRLCEPYVPMDTKALIDSGTNNTVIGSGEVIYNTPYAKRVYYVPAKFNGAPKRGNYWFERMKKEGGLDKILKGAAKLAGGKPGND